MKRKTRENKSSRKILKDPTRVNKSTRNVKKKSLAKINPRENFSPYIYIYCADWVADR